MRKFLKTTTWVFMVLAGVFFWMGLRGDNDQANMEYTIYALVMVIIAWGTNFYLKKRG